MNKEKLFTTGNDRIVMFKSVAILSSVSPLFDVLRELGLSASDFATSANELFVKYGIDVPVDYPGSREQDPTFLKMKAPDLWDEFAVCVGCCILIERDFKVETKIILRELVEKNNRGDMLHATATAVIVLHYLKEHMDVEILKEHKNQKNPDLIIDGNICEVKARDMKSVDPENQEKWEKEGTVEEYDLTERVFLDIGKAFSSSSQIHNGIKKADIIFCDLTSQSLRSLARAPRNRIESIGLSKLKEHRVFLFTRKCTRVHSYFIDIDPSFWTAIRETNVKSSHKIAPLPEDIEIV